MAQTKVTIEPANKKQTLDAFFRYYALSSLLFDNKKAEIYDVTDIPSNNQFHVMAKDKAKELEIDWKTMSHEDSNRIMLAMLEDCWNTIRDIENAQKLNIELTLKFLK
jgi:hypothetical protein